MLARFSETVGPTAASIDCFFGLGLQASDVAYMKPLGRLATTASNQLKRAPSARGGRRQPLSALEQAQQPLIEFIERGTLAAR